MNKPFDNSLVLYDLDALQDIIAFIEVGYLWFTFILSKILKNNLDCYLPLIKIYSRRTIFAS
jgi:hypothetical protein